MNRPATISAALLLLLALSCSPVAAGAKSDITPSAKDKCPVCGMFVAKYPDWTAVSKVTGGASYFFDGPKDMFSHYFNPGRFTPGKQQSDIIALSVKEYYSLKMIAAKNAFYVIGSDVYGPMGGELIPFASQKDASSFMKDHKGKKILRFTEITPQTIKELK